MKLSALILANGLAAVVVAAPSSPYVVHQRRDINIASKWEERHVGIDRREVLPVSIALTQRNLNQGYSYLMDVSDPASQNYGKHWSVDKVIEASLLSTLSPRN
jgi:tripeptidyl-peptidase-1